MDESKLKKHVRTNIVDAAPMTRGEYNAYRGWDAPAAPDEEGYIIFYRKGKPDEYISWCPKKQFDEVSRLAGSMSFGEAIEAMKQGHKVSRRGWNGKGMFLWLKAEVIIKSEWCKDEELKKLVDENGGELPGLGTICMYTHDSSGRRAILTGWLASQTDMLSNDWCIID